MKIIINATILDGTPSGLGIFTKNIIKSLSKIFDNIVVFTPVINQDFKNSNIKIQKVNRFVKPKYGKLGGIIRFLWTQFIFPFRIYKQKNEKMVLYNTTHHSVFFLPKFCKQVITIHDLLAIKFPSRYLMQYYYFKYIMKFLLKKVDMIFCVSINTKNDVKKFYSFSNVKVVYGSYDKIIFNDKTKLVNLNLKDDFFLIVGASYPHKNIEIIINSFLKLKTKNYKFYIVGGRAEYINKLKNLINKLQLNKYFIIKNYVTNIELKNLYSNALALIYPSLYEGFGIPPLEAMACGCPVICSNKSSIPEICGDAALYINPYDSENIIEKINLIIEDEDLRKQLINKGFENIKRFDWNISAKKILEIIENL